MYLIISQGVGYLKLWENTSEGKKMQEIQGNCTGMKQFSSVFQGIRRMNIRSVQLSLEMHISL